MAMSPEEWTHLKELFRTAIEHEPQKRATFLDRACADDPNLRQEIESLLAAHDGAELFIETPAFAGTIKAFTELLDEPVEGRRIGHYQLIREIGRGGMGNVYLAERADEQYRKLVAIKLVRRGMDSEDILRRFRNERQILASLDHPNIARLLDGGTTDGGLPYLVMEYVEGLPITDYCDRQRLTTGERLKLFRTVCAAVQHAHQHLIVHRDLKPSNILITSEGEPKLLDFGIAKLLNPELNTHSVAQTASFARLMTPEYASPEQIRGKKITTGSDVYALGVVLYRLLTSRAPYRFADRSPQEIERLVCDTEPEKPSTVINRTEEIRTGKGSTRLTPEAVGEARHEQPEALRRHLRGDLDNIVLKALRKEPERRYSSAAQFSEDIRRYMDGLPVIARKDTFAYRASKFIGRNKVGAAAAMLVLLAILTGLTVSIWQARVAARERDQARREQAKVEKLNQFLRSILSAASPEEKGRDATVIEVLNDATARIETEFANQPELKAQALLTIGDTYSQLGLTKESEKALRESLNLNIQLYGEESETTAKSMISLGIPLIDESKLMEAETLLSKGIQIERRLNPSGSKELASALFIIGELYVRKSEFEKAKLLLQESLSMSDRISGEKSEDSALTLISIGRAQNLSGDMAGAETTFRKSIALFRQLPQRFEIRMALAMANLGRLLMLKGGYDEAIRTLIEADNIFKKTGESWYVFISKDYLSVAYFSKGDYVKAVEEAERAVDIGRKLKLEATPDFIEALSYLGVGLTRDGRAGEAEAFLREAGERAGNLFPKEDPRIAVTASALGECLTAQSKFAEAEALVVQSYEALRSSRGEKHPQTLAALKRVGELYEKWKKPDQAAHYRALSQ